VLDYNYRDNAPTLDRIISITRDIMADSTSDVKRIQIIGLASIEGSVKHNEQLSQQRAHALKAYIQRELTGVSDTLFDVAAGGEAWAELRDQLNDAITDTAVGTQQPVDTAALRRAIDIIDSEPDLTRREQRLQRLNQGRTYRYIRQYLLPSPTVTTPSS
jgi:hypothetical protein